MKRKLGVLAVTVAIPALILALISGQATTTGVTDLSISEMAATTGAFTTCSYLRRELQSGDDPADGGCDPPETTCWTPSSACGIDYTHYNVSSKCDSPGSPQHECVQTEIGGYWRIEHDCKCENFKCKDSLYPYGERYSAEYNTVSCS